MHPDLNGDPIFGALHPEERARLEGLSSVRRFRSGQTIVSEGQPAGGVFQLRRGAVRVFHRCRTGQEIVVMFCRAPSLFGEIEVVLEIPHIEYVAALEDDTEIVEVPGAPFRDALARLPGLASAVLRDTCAKLAMASHNQKALASQDVTTRLATFLIAYALFDGDVVSPIETRIRARLTQDDMAGALGVTRRAVAEVIARWTREGTLARSGGRYVVRRVDRLSSEAAARHIGLVYDSAAGLVVIPELDRAGSVRALAPTLAPR